MEKEEMGPAQVAEILIEEIFEQFKDNELEINQQISVIVDLKAKLEEFLEKNKHLETEAIVYKEKGSDVEHRVTKSEFYKMVSEIKEELDSTPTNINK